jgi:hypothetical protein
VAADPGRPGYAPEAGYQLAEPFGYWNALGIVVAVGLLLALGFGARAVAGRPQRRIRRYGVKKRARLSRGPLRLAG